MDMVKIGDPAPDFEATDIDGNSVSLKSFIGRNIVLFFYPRDMSPGCTREACTFRDYMDEFKSLDTIVIGISRDPPERHREFRDRYNLPFILISDVDGHIHRLYGVGKFLGILPMRITFIIDRRGVIRNIVKSQFMPRRHVYESLNFLREINKKRG